MTALLRYELLHDDPRFGLAAGDVLLCAPMHPAWAAEKVAVVRRESDGYEPKCSQYRESVRRPPDKVSASGAAINPTDMHSPEVRRG